MTDAPAITGARAGAVDCVCPPGSRLAGAALGAGLGWLTVGAAASVLSQTLMYGLLPLAGAMYAPETALVPVPFVALLVGAVAATFPAAILRDAFGRRAAFALGASLGIAGGLVLAFGLTTAAFWPIVLGAFWIGVANGFALQYRHAAVIGLAPGEAARSLAMVVGASAVVGIVAPLSASAFETGVAPILGAGTAILAALAHVVALAAALALPARGEAPAEAPEGVPSRAGGWLLPTLLGAAAWFGMTAMMVDAPLGLVACGVGLTGTVGVVAWHVVAMYAPAGAIGVLTDRIGVLPTAVAGLALMAGAAAAVVTASDAGTIAAGLIANGVGWSLATSASVVALHAAVPKRLAIAGHDAAILAAAVAGALLSRSIL